MFKFNKTDYSIENFKFVNNMPYCALQYKKLYER